MTLVGQGNILGLDAIDIPSQNPTALYVASPIAPTLKPVPTILYNLGAGDEPQYVPIKVVDPASSIPCPSVPGTPSATSCASYTTNVTQTTSSANKESLSIF